MEEAKTPLSGPDKGATPSYQSSTGQTISSSEVLCMQRGGALRHSMSEIEESWLLPVRASGTHS